MERREFLKAIVASDIGLNIVTQTHALSNGNTKTEEFTSAPKWNSGLIDHLLPTVSSDRFLIKVSFKSPVADPSLDVSGFGRVLGKCNDFEGRFWEFDVAHLKPSSVYQLNLLNSKGSGLCDSWSLKTFPHPSEEPKHIRLMIYTCAGGHDVLGKHLPVSTRAKLLERGLSFKPDAVIANGDHIYWDLKTGRASDRGASPRAKKEVGEFDRLTPILGFPNEVVLKQAVGPQITPLYGTSCRSTPVFFLQDDHDYFENDEADDNYISFPPDPFEFAAARTSQKLYYPEFLPDSNRPLGLASGFAQDRPYGVSESFGTLRYGKLLEVLMYDCRRFLTLKGTSATFIPPEVENWLHQRMKSNDVRHVINMPSTPPGWSAGKWGEWYADIEVNGQLTVKKNKPYWQPGWRHQHDRILKSVSSMQGKIPLMISGDLHAIGETHIFNTSGISLKENPVISVLSGPLGTDANGFPSAKRGLTGSTPANLEVNEILATREKNGFILVDITSDEIKIDFFQWRKESGVDIDSLMPFRTSRFSRSV